MEGLKDKIQEPKKGNISERSEQNRRGANLVSSNCVLQHKVHRENQGKFFLIKVVTIVW